MKRKMRMLMCCVLILFAFGGCQLALENAGTTVYEDRLTGVFVTTEYLDLFDVSGYLNDNLSNFQGGSITVDGDTQKYQGRLYATLTTRTLTSEETGETSQIEEYVFPDIDGISYFSATVPAGEGRDSYTTSISDPAISDGIMNLHSGDETNSTVLEGTIYVSPTSRVRTYYFNPVYQSADGSVYVSSGSGMSVQRMESEGSAMSQTMDAVTAVTKDGKAVTDSISIKLSVSVMFTPQKIVLLQMDADSKLLSRMEYAPDALPESLSPEPETAYFIVETHKQNTTGGDTVARDIYSKFAENIETFFTREDGICVKHWTLIKWPE